MMWQKMSLLVSQKQDTLILHEVAIRGGYTTATDMRWGEMDRLTTEKSDISLNLYN
jgi:hypothetical protein